MAFGVGPKNSPIGAGRPGGRGTGTGRPGAEEGEAEGEACGLSFPHSLVLLLAGRVGMAWLGFDALMAR